MQSEYSNIRGKKVHQLNFTDSIDGLVTWERDIYLHLEEKKRKTCATTESGQAAENFFIVTVEIRGPMDLEPQQVQFVSFIT